MAQRDVISEALAKLYDKTLQEPIPDAWLKLLAKLK
jgi:hypothetical protein